MATNQSIDQEALPVGTDMEGYTITGVIGRGGFGLVYVARDSRTGRSVAIKEFLPSAIAGRVADGRIAPRSVQMGAAYARGLTGFLQEGERLAEFSHPALVTVHRVWQANDTAYMAMQYYPGRTLRDVRLATAEGMSEAHIRKLMEPVLDAVSELHAHRMIHRDVSPDNILVMPSGDTVLLDLGAARHVVGGMTQALTTILKPGFAPIEQYVDDGSMEQGRWTDVYGLGAVIYFLAAGVPPTSSTSRIVRDSMPSLASVAKGFSPSDAMQSAVTKALALRAIERYKSIAEFRNALGWVVVARAPPPLTESKTKVEPRAANETTQVLAAFTAKDILKKTAPNVPDDAANSKRSEGTQQSRADVKPVPRGGAAAKPQQALKNRGEKYEKHEKYEKYDRQNKPDKNVKPGPRPSVRNPPPSTHFGLYVGVAVALLIAAAIVWRLLS